MQIKKALQAIKEAERPIICCGGGVVLAGAQRGNDRVCPQQRHPCDRHDDGASASCRWIATYYLGMIGSHGRTSANKAMQRGGPRSSCAARVWATVRSLRRSSLAEKAKIIHIDIDPAEIGKNMTAHIPIVGDIRLVLL